MRDLDFALLRAQEKFRDVLARAGDHPPVLDRIEVNTDFDSLKLMFFAVFRDMSVQSPSPSGLVRVQWELSRNIVEGMPHTNLLINEYRSLYSRMYEDHLMEMELRPRREIIDELLRLNAEPTIIAIARRQYDEFARHVHLNHQYGRHIRSQFTERSYSTERLIVEPLPYQESSAAMERMAADMLRAVDERSYQAFTGGSLASQVRSWPSVCEMQVRAAQQLAHERYRFGLDPYSALASYEVGTEVAQAKGLDLLKSWLTPEQAAQYEKYKHFEVVGSDTKKRYRIRHGRQVNVDELNAKGDVVRKLCALPEGNLVTADVMLGQKVTLETDERKFLAKANVFGDTTRQSNRYVWDDRYF